MALVYDQNEFGALTVAVLGRKNRFVEKHKKYEQIGGVLAVAVVAQEAKLVLDTALRNWWLGILLMEMRRYGRWIVSVAVDSRRET